MLLYAENYSAEIRLKAHSERLHISDFCYKHLFYITSFEYQNIFNTVDNTSAIKFLILKSELERTTNKNFYFPTSKTSFLNILENHLHKRPLVLIGHNQGGDFKFPDGSSLTFNQIDEFVDNADKFPIIYLSCNALEYSKNTTIDFKLTYEDALNISLSLDVAFSKEKNLDNEKIKKNLKQIVDNYLIQKGFKNKAKIAGLSIAGITGLYFIYEVRNEKK